MKSCFRNRSTAPLPGTASKSFAEPGSRAPSLAAGAMLSFQETMQAFLQTQQEVMAAYLDGTPIDQHSTASLSGFAGCAAARR